MLRYFIVKHDKILITMKMNVKSNQKLFILCHSQRMKYFSVSSRHFIDSIMAFPAHTSLCIQLSKKRSQRFPCGWHNSFWERSLSSCFNMSNSALPWLQWVCLSLQMETLIYCCSLHTHTNTHTLFLCNICFSDITWIQTAWLRKCSRMSMQTKKTADVPFVTVINSLFFPLPMMCFQRQMEGGGAFISTELSSDRLGMSFCWVM